MAKKINYNARSFEDYKEQLKDFTKKYYPTIINDFNDSSIGQWFIDLNSAVADDLGFYMDRMFQETQLDQAQDRRSVLNIARTNGIKVTGKRPSIVEAQWSCYLPVDSTNGRYDPDYNYAPILSKGTQASGGGQKFELLEDLDFSQQFNRQGVSDRTFTPIKNTNGGIDGYTVTKTCVMASIETKIYKYQVNYYDVKPFMEIILPELNVIGINSIIIKEGTNTTTPSLSEFMSDSEDRWYEVNSLIEDKIYVKDFVESKSFADKLILDMSLGAQVESVMQYGNTYYAKTEDGSKVYGFIPSVGKWIGVPQKFITEYTDKGYNKIIFGSSSNLLDLNDLNYYNATDFAKYQLNSIINNEFLGKLPPSNSTIYISYSVGGGVESNIAANSMTTIPLMNLSIVGTDQTKINRVKNSITVTNTIPSVSGRDELSTDELRYLIKYNNAAQDRCVTLKDYYNKIMTMPSEFGSPFKVSVSEQNNKVLVTLLGLAYDGTLSNNISQIMIDNISEYLSEYRMLNDYVELQPGRIINLKFVVDVKINSGYQKQDVAKEIMLYIGDYMDVKKHRLGDDIYINKIKSYISGLNGVKNLIDIKVYNVYGGLYSANHTKQAIIQAQSAQNQDLIDLTASEGVLYADEDSMFEIKYPNNPTKDIIVNAYY